MKSLAAVRYSKDSPEAFGLEQSENFATARSQKVRTSLPSSAVRVTPQLFPAVARAMEFALEKLHPSLKIEAYIASNPYPNAACIPLQGDLEAALVVSSSLVELLSEGELSFVMGHEIGHQLFGHARYAQDDESMEEVQRLRVLALGRASEISADRLGFVCSPTMEDAFRGMLKVASGLSDRHVRLDLSSYLGQLRELRSLSGHHDAIYDTHPMFPLRVRALLWFSMSEPYYYWIDRSGAAPISAETLNERVEADFGAVSGFGLDHIESEGLRALKIWSMVKLVSLDGRIAREEQRILAEVLGADEAQSAIRFVSGHGNEAPSVIQRKLDDAVEAAREAPEKLRLELLEELERVASAATGTNEQRVELLGQIGHALGLDHDVQIRPWSFRASSASSSG